MEMQHLCRADPSCSDTQVAARPRLQCDPGYARPRSCATWAALDLGRARTPVSGFFFFFLSFFLLWWTHIFCCCGFLLLLSLRFCLPFILVVNRVLETRFPCRCHVEKLSHQMWTTHKNHVPKTQFIDPKSSLLNSKC